MKVFVYANCQGKAFETFLPMIDDRLVVRHVENYRALSGEVKLASFADDLARADVLIYQPIGEAHGELSTAAPDGILSRIRQGCDTASFPYLYNDGIWPCIYHSDHIENGEVIDPLLEQGATEDDIVAAYAQGDIDFRLRERYEASLKLLQSREVETDVRVADYLNDRLTTQEMLLTCNHPTTAFFGEAVRQITKKLGLKCDLDFEAMGRNVVDLPGRAPLPTISIREFGMKICPDPSEEADKYFADLLRQHSRYWHAQREQTSTAS